MLLKGPLETTILKIKSNSQQMKPEQINWGIFRLKNLFHSSSTDWVTGRQKEQKLAK